MKNRELIIAALNKKQILTQIQLSEEIYGDKKHGPNIYGALTSLVSDAVISKSGQQPAYYSLTGKEIPKGEKKSSRKKQLRDVSNDIISNETLDQTEEQVMNTESYGSENNLITRCLKRFPDNTEPEIVAMKIGLIDITNSTHLSQHKSLISMNEFAEYIVHIYHIDERIKAGDSEVVNEIAKSNGKINLFSFATKYCCYHNRNLYERDDYSIMDNVVKDYLPLYFPEIMKTQFQKWQKKYQYNEFNTFITKKLDELEITTEFRKRKFDHFVDPVTKFV